MKDKPRFASAHSSEQYELVRATCLYVATVLGDLTDEFVVVGGLVPSLLIDQSSFTGNTTAHVGTMDLDLGFELAILREERYREITARLRGAGFAPDRTEEGSIIRQRWRAMAGSSLVSIDFLIPPSSPGDRGGRLRNIEKDFAAIITPGLDLAFIDKRRVSLSGMTIRDERATREIWVCGPGAFVVLKALAFLGRGENKDAYDLYYLIRNFGSGIEELAACLRPLMDSDFTKQALKVLHNDFCSHDATGPRRVADFLQGEHDDVIQADVVGFISALLDLC